MHHRSFYWLYVVGLIIVLLQLGACREAEKPATEEPARIEDVAGTEFDRVILTPQAIERVGIETAAVRSLENPHPQPVVPYSALIYGLNGETWVYTNPESQVYVRQPITIDRIEGGQVYLSDGPPVDTIIVVAGAANLYGVELGLDK